jgi:hypothetical protein
VKSGHDWNLLCSIWEAVSLFQLVSGRRAAATALSTDRARASKLERMIYRRQRAVVREPAQDSHRTTKSSTAAAFLTTSRPVALNQSWPLASTGGRELLFDVDINDNNGDDMEPSGRVFIKPGHLLVSAVGVINSALGWRLFCSFPLTVCPTRSPAKNNRPPSEQSRQFLAAISDGERERERERVAAVSLGA